MLPTLLARTKIKTEESRAFSQEGNPPEDMKGDADKLVRPIFKPVDQSAGAAQKIYKGQYSGQSRAHLDLLESRLHDPRRHFLFRPGKWSVTTDGITEGDLDSLLATWVGADVPISVFDLSGVPPSIVDDIVGTMLRILYDAMFWGRLKEEGGRLRPLLIVLEEAHSYLGKDSKNRAAAATRRIAKEGRKYGVGLMLVSQRPSEIDPTILSQCGTIAAMRLTNEQDQGQVSKCAADNLKGLFSMLPVLRTGEALVVGEAVNMPIRTLIDRPPEGCRPDSDDPLVVVPKAADGKRKWQGGWTEPVPSENYKPLVEAWRKQDPDAGANGSLSVSEVSSTKE